MTGMRHPRRDDAGAIVVIRKPDTASSRSSWADPAQAAVFPPNASVPSTLNGTSMAPWRPSEAGQAWETMATAMQVVEPAFEAPAGLDAAAGVFILEEDGRAWCVAPTNGWGGHRYTLPKGRADGRSLQATSLCEAFEETGLKVRLIGHLHTGPRSVTYTRFYLAVRVGGSPVEFGFETQATVLAPLPVLAAMLTHPGDREVLIAAMDTFPRQGLS